jgi:hypothetical protein
MKYWVILGALLLGATILACGGGASDETPSPDPGAGNLWDQMKWGQGRWG